MGRSPLMSGCECKPGRAQLSIKGVSDMLIQRASDIPSSEITPERLYSNRREFIKTASSALGTAAVISILPGCMNSSASGTAQNKARGPYDTDEKQTPYEDIISYNNYY